VAGTTYSWTLLPTPLAPNITSTAPTSGSGTINAETFINNITNPIVLSYTITPSAASCPGVPFTYNVTVNPSPSINFSIPNQTICSGQTTTLVDLTSATTGASISWTSSPPAGVSGSTTSGTNTIPSQVIFNNTNAPITITYQAVATVQGNTPCPGSVFTYEITVNPIPDGAATPLADTICSNANTSIVATSSVSGATFTFNAVAGLNITGSSNVTTPIPGPASISQNLTNTGSTLDSVQYIITPFANGCPGLPDTVVVFVQPIPQVVFTPPNQTICSGETSLQIDLSSGVSGVTYSWSTGATTVGGVSPTTGNISVIPAMTLTNTSTSVATVVISATATIDGCPGPNTSSTITVNPIPSITNTITSQTVCTGVATQVVNFTSNLNAPLLTTFDWTLVNANGVTGAQASGTGPLPSMVLGNGSTSQQQVVYQITPVSNGCVGAAFTYTINVDPGPTVDPIPDQTICSGDATSLVTPTGSVANTIYSWSATPPPGISPSGNISGTGTINPQVWTNTTALPIVISYTVTPSAAGCPGLPETFVVTVNPTPYFNNLPSQTICSGSNINQVNIASLTPNVVFAWNLNPPSGITGAITSGSNIIPSHTILNNTSAPIVLTYQITATYTNNNTTCVNDTSYTITVNPIPDMFVTPVIDTICSNTSTAILASSSGLRSRSGLVDWVRAKCHALGGPGLRPGRRSVASS
jgi:hypothetical protein